MNREWELGYTAQTCLEIYDRYGEFAMLNYALRLGKPTSDMDLQFGDGSRIECILSQAHYQFHQNGAPVKSATPLSHNPFQDKKNQRKSRFPS